MIKHTITYTDFFDNKHTEDFWFHLSKPEITELEHSIEGGFSGLLAQLVAAPTVKVVTEIVKNLILLSIGERSSDGKAFLKAKTGSELARTFASHAAFEVMFVELATDPEKLLSWIEGIMPSDMMAEVKDTTQYKELLTEFKKASETQSTSTMQPLPPPPPAA